jgi:uncharacterized protein (TIGR02145 family)
MKIALATILFAFSVCLAAASLQYGGQTYKTVKIGEQTWMAENLNYEAEGSKCYDNNPANCAKYGRLYNWETAMKVCPKGWHLPSNEDWDKLLRFIDGNIGAESPYQSPTAGKHLKATSGWDNDIEDNSSNGTDAYGFSALPGGKYGHNVFYGVIFYDIGFKGYWWSANEEDRTLTYLLYLNNSLWAFLFLAGNMFDLLSVRCLQD